MYLCGAAYSTPQKAMLCHATAETFSPVMAYTAVSRDELAALGQGPLPYVLDSKLPLHLVQVRFLHRGLK